MEQGTSRLKRKQARGQFLMALPLILFTVLFIVGPIVYMVVLSFLTRGETWGVVPEFTLKNYADITQPVYLQTFGQSLRLAVISTLLVIALGYPFGYFMAKLGPKWKKRTMLLLMIPFWTSSLIRLYGWIIIFRAGGVLDTVLQGLHITEEPLKLLYTYPAVVVGMIYALLPFMIFAVYSSAEKLDFSLVEAARDLGASPMKAFLTVSLKLTLPGAALRGGAHLCAQHGAVLHCGHPGGQQGGAGGQRDPGTADEGPQLALCGGPLRGAAGADHGDHLAVPQTLRRERPGRYCLR